MDFLRPTATDKKPPQGGRRREDQTGRSFIKGDFARAKGFTGAARNFVDADADWCVWVWFSMDLSPPGLILRPPSSLWRFQPVGALQDPPNSDLTGRRWP